MLIKNIIKGSVCSIRNSYLRDCKKILALRTDPKLSKHLNKVENCLKNSEKWLMNQRASKDKFSLTIIDQYNRVVGFFTTFTLFEDNKFDPGGWIISEKIQANVKLCSLVLAYEIGFNILNIENAFLRVRKGNYKIINMHEKMGAVKISDDDDLEYLIMEKKIHNNSLFRKIFING